MQEYQAMWRNYLNFYDRTSVRGYWMAVLFNFVATLALTLIGKIIPFLSFVGTLYGLAIIIPGIAITVRRLRDTNRRWIYILIALIPVIGEILLIIWLCQPTSNWQGNQVWSLITKQKRPLYRLIISIILIGCAYALPSLLTHTDSIALITAILLTIGVILLISSVKSLTRMH